MLRYISFVAALVAFLAPLPAPAETTIAQILAKPSTYDGVHVTVSGTITKLDRKVSDKGNHYVTLWLCSDQCILVYGNGTPKITDGQTIKVFGTFSVVRHIGSYTFNNGIYADYDSLSP
jgi:hypothetical protein